MEGEHKPHRAAKKKKQVQHSGNVKAFATGGRTAEFQARRAQDLLQRKLHVPMLDKVTAGKNTPPPMLVAVVGSPGVGKTTLIKSLVRHYTKYTLETPSGPITCISSKQSRLTLLETPPFLPAMIDVAKIVDLVILLVDGNYGFEMETMEFLSIMGTHGQAKVLTALTHLDLFKKPDRLKAAKHKIKHRLWQDLYPGAKVFYFSGVLNGRYPDRETLNLSRFIAIMKTRPVLFRQNHSFVLSDRWEDITPPSQIENDELCDRTVSMYGYVRGGSALRLSQRVHVPGLGDFSISKLDQLPDPCEMPKKKEGDRRRPLSEKQRKVYAPMSDVGGLLFDQDTVKVNIPEKSRGFTGDVDEEELGEGEAMVRRLHFSKPLAAQNSSFKLFTSEMDDGTGRKELRYANIQGVEGLDNDIEEGQMVSESDSAISSDNGEDLDLPSESDDDDDGRDEIEKSDTNLRWKDNIKERANAKLEKVNEVIHSEMNSLLYGDKSVKDIVSAFKGENSHEVESDGESEDFFKRSKSFQPISKSRDGSRPLVEMARLSEWDDDEKLDSIRNLFVTGSMIPEEAEENEAGEPDFEDLEAGQNSEDEAQNGGESEPEPEPEEEELETEETDFAKQREENLRKKLEMRLRFEELETADRDEKKPEQDAQARGETTWLDEQKALMSKQLDVNQSLMDDLDDETRAKVEGFRAGTYVRIVLERVPCEFVTNFNPKWPLILGELQAIEQRFGFIQIRLKKHRWHKRILKSDDPLIVSLGWRRFQTIPIFSTSDSRTRNRLLKYTPEHMHCFATIYGPLSAANTGLCAVQSVASADASAAFRIAATGVVLDIDNSTEIVKKLKLTGTPTKIFKNTAFIKNMFNSAIEVARFEGAQIRSVSGIRGQIKKALGEKPGQFRATFEDKLLMSDIVFLRAWVPVTPRKFYNPVLSLLADKQEDWEGMRLTNTVRFEENIPIPNKQDSSYGTIERVTRRFNRLHVPKKLQSALPYASKIREAKPQRNKTYMQKRAIVAGPEEKRARTLLQQVMTLRNEKERKREEREAERRAKREKENLKSEGQRRQREKEAKKEYWEREGKKRKNESAGGSRKKTKKNVAKE